jgi:hypothetical protein
MVLPCIFRELPCNYTGLCMQRIQDRTVLAFNVNLFQLTMLIHQVPPVSPHDKALTTCDSVQGFWDPPFLPSKAAKVGQPNEVYIVQCKLDAYPALIHIKNADAAAFMTAASCMHKSMHACRPQA